MEQEKERISQLVVQMQNGDSKAFDELYRLTSSRAYFVALEITKNEQDAEDILQESYINAIAKINTLDKPESFVSWLHHIVANKSKDSLRKKKPTLFEDGEDEAFEVIPDEDTSFSPEDNLNQAELQKAVMEVIGELTKEKRACVLMMYFEEMSVNEIAETLDIPVSTVKNRLFTARKDLKAKFEKRGITAVYSTAPIGVVIWALTRTADAISKTFPGSAASTEIFAGITAASSAGAAAAGTGVAAKAAALTVAQKVAAGVTVAGVVTASAVGVVTVAKNNAKEEITTTTFAYTEEVTTAPTTEAESAIMAIIESRTETTTVRETTTVHSTTTKKAEPTAATAVTTTKALTTMPSTTAKPKTTKATTTRRDYSLNSTTKMTFSETTTLAETSTTRRQRSTTTEASTTSRNTVAGANTAEATTKAASATVIINVYDLDNNVVDTLTETVEAGESISRAYIVQVVESAGHTPDGGLFVEDGETYSFGVTAESGETYRFRAEL